MCFKVKKLILNYILTVELDLAELYFQNVRFNFRLNLMGHSFSSYNHKNLNILYISFYVSLKMLNVNIAWSSVWLLHNNALPQDFTIHICLGVYDPITTISIILDWCEETVGFNVHILLSSISNWMKANRSMVSFWRKEGCSVFQTEKMRGKIKKRLNYIKRNEIGSLVETWMDLGTVIQSVVSQKEKNKYRILMHICGI